MSLAVIQATLVDRHHAIGSEFVNFVIISGCGLFAMTVDTGEFWKAFAAFGVGCGGVAALLKVVLDAMERRSERKAGVTEVKRQEHRAERKEELKIALDTVPPSTPTAHTEG